MTTPLNRTSPLGWYGKLPGSGDFMRRRLPARLVDNWAQWFQSSLPRLAQQPASGRAPVWNFIIPATLGVPMIQMGCLLPTRDRVGRQYPLCAMQLFAPADWHAMQLHTAGDWYHQLGKTLTLAVQNRYSGDQFDRALNALPAQLARPPQSDVFDVIGYQDTPCNLNWPQVVHYFDPAQYSSFWWSNQSDGSAFYSHSHSGNFTTQLFLRLFNPPHASRGEPPLFGQS